MFYVLLVSPLLLLTLCVWVVAVVIGWSYGKLGRAIAATRVATRAKLDEATPQKWLSVILCVHNQAEALRRHLPTILNQDYDAFEIIVVDMASTDDTRIVLEAFELDHPNLRHTYTPSSTRDLSLERLALSLGIRAARGEWVVLTKAGAEPLSPRWLRTIAGAATEWRNLLLAPARYADDAPLRPRFLRLWNTFLTANHVLAGNIAVRGDAANMAIRRSALVESGSSADDCNLRFGAIDIIVNRLARHRSTAYLADESAVVVEDAPASLRIWHDHQKFDIETRHHLRHKTLQCIKKLLFILMPWLLTAVTAVSLAISIIAALCASDGQPLPESLISYGRTAASITYDAQDTYIAAIVVATTLVLMFLIYLVINALAFNQSTRALGAGRMTCAALWFEAMLPFSSFATWWAWLRTPRNEFRKKFV